MNLNYFINWSMRDNYLAVSNSNRFAALYAMLVFFFSMMLLPYYSGGDQRNYIHVYSHLHLFDNVLDAYRYYKKLLGSSEVIHFLFLYFLSEIIPKELLVSIVNSLLAFFVSRWMFLNNVHWFIVLSSLPNFYAWVVYLPAERLKFGFFCVLLVMLMKHRARYIAYVLAVLSHFQMMLVVFVLELKRHLSFEVRGSKNTVMHGFIYLSLVLVIVSPIFLFSDIQNKLLIYYRAFGGIDAVIKPAIFMVLTFLFVGRDKFGEVLLLHAPVIIASIVVGAERLTIISYFIFMYYGLLYKNGLNLLVFLTSVYFGVKGLLFIGRVIQFGDGFYYG